MRSCPLSFAGTEVLGYRSCESFCLIVAAASGSPVERMDRLAPDPPGRSSGSCSSSDARSPATIRSATLDWARTASPSPPAEW